LKLTQHDGQVRNRFSAAGNSSAMTEHINNQPGPMIDARAPLPGPLILNLVRHRGVFVDSLTLLSPDHGGQREDLDAAITAGYRMLMERLDDW
jgi:hypothetical protein